MSLSSVRSRILAWAVTLLLGAAAAGAEPVFSGPEATAPETTSIDFGRVRFTLPGRWQKTVAHGGVVLLIWPAGRQDFAVWIYKDAPLGGLTLEQHLTRVLDPSERGRIVDGEKSMAAPKVWTTDGGCRAAFQWRVTQAGAGPSTMSSYMAFDRGDHAQVVVINAYGEAAEKAFGKTVGVALRQVGPWGK